MSKYESYLNATTGGVQEISQPFHFYYVDNKDKYTHLTLSLHSFISSIGRQTMTKCPFDFVLIRGSLSVSGVYVLSVISPGHYTIQTITPFIITHDY